MNTIQGRGVKRLALRRMAIAAAMVVILALNMGVALANNNDYPLMTADQVSGTKHGDRLMLKGHVTPLSADHFTFTDDTGSIAILMTDAQWQAAKATSEDTVELYGKTYLQSGEGLMFRVRRANKVE